MAEITPSGVIVTGAPTNVRANTQLPGSREVLENIYNDFLDAKQKNELALDVTFDSWIRKSINMLKGHRQQEIKDQFSIGQIGRAEFEALDEYRKKLVIMLEKAEPRYWNFDQYGIQYVQTENRHLLKERVGPDEVVLPNHRPVHIQTGPSNGIIRA